MNDIDPKELRAQLEARRKEFDDPRLTMAAALLGKEIAWEAARMENDKRLVEVSLGRPALLPPSPILDEVRSHVNANTGAPKWIAEAWERGETWMREQQKKTGSTPSVIKIAMYVEGELSNRGITGPSGRLLDAETIKREALTGITGRKRGENLRR